jgi:carotenoid cleavage dioxygenase-like enzyme
MNRQRIQRVATTLAAATLLAGAVPLAAQQQDVPEGYVQILQRGGIPAIDDPVYIPAAEAQIREDAWVLGVVIDGQARAYSLALLNSHEVVNDSIGDTDFAAVW